MREGDEITRGRKKYEPPKVTVISLRPEEAVLGNCKSMVVSGPSAGPSSCMATVACQSIGS